LRIFFFQFTHRTTDQQTKVSTENTSQWKKALYLLYINTIHMYMLFLILDLYCYL